MKLDVRLPLTGKSAVANAIATACIAHGHQRDKGGEHYIMHCLHVMRHVEPQSDEYRIAAVLHDVVEDSPDFCLNNLREANLSETIIAALDALSRREGESYYDYIGRVCENQIACAVKRVDLAHNMDIARLKEPGPKDYERVREYAAAWGRVYATQRSKGWL